jgi:glutathione S-transferase
VSGRITVWGVGTPRTLRVHWMLHELGLEYETRAIGSRTGETRTEGFLGLNPRGKIPVLEDGELVLSESAAIVTYLAETYGGATGLIPEAGTPERAGYFEWLAFSLSELDATSLYVIRRHGDLAEIYGDAPAAVRSAQEYFETLLRVATPRFADGRSYLLGETFTGADILLSSCIAWGLFLGFAVDPELRDYLARTSARPAQRAAAALNYADGAGR